MRHEPYFGLRLITKRYRKFHVRRGKVCVAAQAASPLRDYSCCALPMTSIAFCWSAASTELGSSRLPIFFRRGDHGGPEVQQLSMTYAGQRRWLAIATLAVLAVLVGRDVRARRSRKPAIVDRARRSQGAARLRRSAQSAVLQREGRGVREELAELFAEKLNKKLDYMYFPQATGIVRMTLGAHRCDVIMGFPQGDDRSRAPIPITAPPMRWSPSRAAASKTLRRWKTSA